MGDLVLRLGTAPPGVATGTTPRGVAWLILPLEPTPGLHLLGAPAAAGRLAAIGPEATWEAASPAPWPWAMLMLPQAAATEKLCLPRRSTLLRPGASALLMVAAEAHAAAGALVRDVAEVLAVDPDCLAGEAARCALYEALLAACREMLGSLAERARPVPRASSAQRQLAHAAVAAIAGAGAARLDPATLAARLGCGMGRLRTACGATLGLGPESLLAAPGRTGHGPGPMMPCDHTCVAPGASWQAGWTPADPGRRGM